MRDHAKNTVKAIQFQNQMPSKAETQTARALCIKRKVGREVTQTTSYEESTHVKLFCNLEGKSRRRGKTGQLGWENLGEKGKQFAVGALCCRDRDRVFYLGTSH